MIGQFSPSPKFDKQQNGASARQMDGASSRAGDKADSRQPTEDCPVAMASQAQAANR